MRSYQMQVEDPFVAYLTMRSSTSKHSQRLDHNFSEKRRKKGTIDILQNYE